MEQHDDIEQLLRAAAIRLQRDATDQLPALSRCHASAWPDSREPDLRATVRPPRRGRNLQERK